MLQEIREIPEKAEAFIAGSGNFALPIGVPYLGMGSSYFASLAFKYMGVDIYPEMASEYYHYLSQGTVQPLGVILSQSGRSSEALWCRERFGNYVAISNDRSSPLAVHRGVIQVVELLAGQEHYSSSKTYVNTLLALFKGFGMDTGGKTIRLRERMGYYEEQGRMLADGVFNVLKQKKVTGLYITGSGPNLATALQAALILSEMTKLGFQGLALGQYDHGPKETARESVVIQIISHGASYDRNEKVRQMIEPAGAHVFRVEEPLADEWSSVLSTIIPFNFMGYYLAKYLEVGETFAVGGKVTEVN